MEENWSELLVENGQHDQACFNTARFVPLAVGGYGDEVGGGFGGGDGDDDDPCRMMECTTFLGCRDCAEWGDVGSGSAGASNGLS